MKHLENIKRCRFQRGKDRRTSQDPKDLELRKEERRKLGVNCLLLFKETDEKKILPVLEHCEVLCLPEGSTLLKPGDNNENVYILLSGQLAAFLGNSVKPESALPIPPGECIGEFSVIDGKPVSALVIAMQSARVLMLPSHIFWEQLLPIPGVTRNLLKTLTDRMRRSNEVTLDAQRKQMALRYIQQELELARQLQAAMLPLRRPLFADRDDLEIAGIMDPASEIGGDLFDTFFVDEHLLFFCIGDVSGHGIPAALFMARTIGLIHISAMGTNRPDHVLERVNNQLCIGNETNMFVTLMCGFLDLHTGQLSYSNAGHCPPFLIKQGKVLSLPIPKGCLLGVIANNHYHAHEINLEIGDILVTYTDGIVEAETPNGEPYSTTKFIDLLSNNYQQPLESLTEIVRQSVISFCEKPIMNDDCTMLVLRRL